MDVNLSSAHLVGLVKRKIPAFSAPESIIILDGDVRKDKEEIKIIAKSHNVLVLPSDKSPEQLVSLYLHELSDSDIVWESIGEGYSKQVCFRNYILSDILTDRVKAKAWFRRELPNWGINASKVLSPLFKKYEDNRKDFISDFEEMQKYF